jgi:hypothetical protein
MKPDNMNDKQKIIRYIDSLGLLHFSGAEVVRTIERSRKTVGAFGVASITHNDIPPEDMWPNIVTCLVVLDALRERYGSPIRIHSTYRNPNYNQAVGGAERSYHVRFRAVDFSVPGIRPREVAATLRGCYRGKSFVRRVPLGGSK